MTLCMFYLRLPQYPAALATIGEMNVLIEIGSTNPADNEVDGNGSAPIRNTMETLLVALLRTSW